MKYFPVLAIPNPTKSLCGCGSKRNLNDVMLLLGMTLSLTDRWKRQCHLNTAQSTTTIRFLTDFVDLQVIVKCPENDERPA